MISALSDFKHVFFIGIAGVGIPAGVVRPAGFAVVSGAAVLALYMGQQLGPQ